ncbi:response regulator [Spartinivicinus ruber]|uniref:response regulator n=1 Tax=Spartinivicinus ruber TaxID=2683272 RepID=UPI0013D1BEB5|nr:response regulator [Spartinivicinus ruber]
MHLQKILIIDDDQVDRIRVKRYLSQSELSQNIQISEVTTADEGLQLYADEGGFDVVLLDYMLPDHDGIYVLQKLLWEQDPLATVIALTGHGNELSKVSGD